MFAQEGDAFSFPEEIVPYGEELKFNTITADSAKSIIEGEQKTSIDNDDPNVMMYEYEVGDRVYLAIKTNNKWKSGFVSVRYSTFFGSGLEYELVRLGEDRVGVLVANHSNSSKGSRYYNYDYRSATYDLIDVFTGSVYSLGQTYTDEGNGYTGFTAESEDDEEKEMVEMDKEKNWSHRYEALEYEIKVLPNKIVFQNIVCAGCEVEGLDDVSSIEYTWNGSKLTKSNVVAK